MNAVESLYPKHASAIPAREHVREALRALEVAREDWRAKVVVARQFEHAALASRSWESAAAHQGQAEAYEQALLDTGPAFEQLQAAWQAVQ